MNDAAAPALERFRLLIPRSHERGVVEELALLAGAHVAALALPTVDSFVLRWTTELDRIAASCPQPTFEGIGQHLFADLGFAGNTADYYDPRNSYLHEVVDRRLGIPITLSLVALSVAERLDVPMVGVGMPGHFLVGDAADRDRFLDPFAGGAALDSSGVEQLFRNLHGEDAHLSPALLAPVDAPAILARLLANLKHIHSRRRDRRALVRVLELRVLVPGVPVTERRELASALASVGRFDLAAAELDTLADVETAAGEADAAAATRAVAAQSRARLN